MSYNPPLTGHEKESMCRGRWPRSRLLSLHRAPRVHTSCTATSQQPLLLCSRLLEVFRQTSSNHIAVWVVTEVYQATTCTNNFASSIIGLTLSLLKGSSEEWILAASSDTPPICTQSLHWTPPAFACHHLWSWRHGGSVQYYPWKASQKAVEVFTVTFSQSANAHRPPRSFP